MFYNSPMSSFHQLKTKRDRRHPAQYVQASSTSTGESTQQKSAGLEQPPSVSLPDGVEVKTDKKRGRGLYVSKAYQAGMSCALPRVRPQFFPGKSVLSATPLQAILSTSNLSSTCSGCLLTPREIAIKTGRSPVLAPCTRCSILHYCSDVRSLFYFRRALTG